MNNIFGLNINYSKKTLIVIAILLILLFNPYPIPFINDYIKQRVLTVGILFLTLVGITPDYYFSTLGILFLIAIILSSTFSFGYIVLGTLFLFIVLKAFKKI